MKSRKNHIERYRRFLQAKIAMAPVHGFEVSLDEINPLLKPHQRLIVQWACRGGRRAIFAAFGLGKTIIQLEILRLILKRFGGRALIIAPLGVRQEFFRDACMLGTELRFVQSDDEVDETGIYLANYEPVRDGKLDPTLFIAVSLDEASCLRGFGGTKTFREFMATIAGDDRSGGIRHEGLRFRFVATATPAPNEYIELLAYSAFLGVMDVGQAKTRFFKRNSEKADELTIHPHKEREFWLWCASWGIFVQKPSDLGFSDDGYELPALTVNWHEVPTDHSDAGQERDGQARMFRNAAVGVVEASREKRESLKGRLAKLFELRAQDANAHRLIWHDLEAERHAIETAAAIPCVYGSQDLEDREELIVAFADGRLQELGGKPSMLGSGPNFQKHCAWAIFLGIGFKFNDFIQAIHRLQRFLQERPVRIDLIYTEAEREIRRTLEAKWARHDELVAEMTAIIREYGLNEIAITSTMQRSIGCERLERSGETWRMINVDAVEETTAMESDSVDLIVTSIPFSTQYEYTPSYNDFGHTDTNDHFWRQMDFLTPELLRVLRPGRVAAIHVKDRIVPGGLTGLGFQTLYAFHADCLTHFQRHGWAFLGMKTIVTDVVRENNQTYRLGWSEQCKDGSRQGCGVPEYLMLFRKPPTDRSNGYADLPVVKLKKILGPDGWENREGYSRARWQVDAHGFSRSSGNRLLAPSDLVGLDANVIFKLFREHTLNQVYDFENHVACAEALEEARQLPKTFMLLQPASWHPDVWTDITRMRTLNGSQHAAGREMHLCPLQFDIVDRAVAQLSMNGETVYDPFAGIGTVPLRAIMQGRRGLGVELNPGYCRDACAYLEAEEERRATPSLFDALQLEAAE